MNAADMFGSGQDDLVIFPPIHLPSTRIRWMTLKIIAYRIRWVTIYRGVRLAVREAEVRWLSDIMTPMVNRLYIGKHQRDAHH